MLTSTERGRIEERLIAERERTLAALQEFDEMRENSLREDTGELTVNRLHPADIGTDAMEREKQFLLASVEGRRLHEIDDALRRLYADPGTFGVCVDCGRDIGVERLDVVPEAVRCADCQRAAES